MDYEFQKSAIESITHLAKSNCQSILIEGIPGSGKTYLAKLYRKLCNIPDFIEVESSVQKIREVIDNYAITQTPAIICIENLDKGSSAAIGTTLKFLEEPNHNIKLIVTCISQYRLPDTISSRCAVVSVPNPNIHDITQYAKLQDTPKYEFLLQNPINNIVMSFSDIDNIFSLNNEQIQYISNTATTHKGYIKKPINGTLWDFTHFADNTEIPLPIIKLRIRYILSCNIDIRIRKMCLNCLDELENNRIATHVVLYKFLLDFTSYIP